MSIVLPSTTKDFALLAEEVADKLFKSGTPLTDGVSEVAMREGLNPTEVKRLTEKTNVLATVRMLRSSTDKKATIDLADYSEVMEKTHPVAETSSDDEDEDNDMPDGQEKTAALRETRKRNAFADLQTIFNLHGHAKTASEYKKPTQHVAIFKIKKDLEELKQQKMAMEIKVKDGLDFLASEFSKYNGPDFGKFASEAIAVNGKKCLPVIDSLAAYTRCKYDNTKVASYIVNDTTSLHVKLASVCKSIVDIIAYENRVKALEETLAKTWEAAKKG